ncbi:MAG: tRNA (adenosine(37)-N6)-threonylcarbamoyltransferase complex transferase subunit TsaD, partial [Desulfobacterales bacterium]|nr:tRNA (adenosine(37)-N6)-threonylcarbamoyltransferase complex transferase subunit TsaD [Desulfobacterales bacterium]
GLGYPGGPEIDKRASQGNAEAVSFPRAYLPDTLDFSFSGLKTAVKLAVEGDPSLSVEDVAASFQASVVDVLVRKIEWAMKKYGIRHVTLSGGV